MNHRVAVWTDRTEISDGINILFAHSEWGEMMNVDVTFTDGTIPTSEVEAAYGASIAVDADAGRARCRVALTPTLNDVSKIAFAEYCHFIGGGRSRWRVLLPSIVQNSGIARYVRDPLRNAYILPDAEFRARTICFLCIKDNVSRFV